MSRNRRDNQKRRAQNTSRDVHRGATNLPSVRNTSKQQSISTCQEGTHKRMSRVRVDSMRCMLYHVAPTRLHPSRYFSFFAHNRPVLCLGCREADANPKACRECGESQALTAFRRSKGNRVDTCKTCDRIKCATCAASLPVSAFADRDVNNHYVLERRIVCLTCKEHGYSARRPEQYLCAGPCQRLLGHEAFSYRDRKMKTNSEGRGMLCRDCKKKETDREKYLQNLMMNSKRKTCTCKTPFAHSEKCPMHIRAAGERPYPGCDVMSREDSDWLQQQRRKRKAKAVITG